MRRSPSSRWLLAALPLVLLPLHCAPKTTGPQPPPSPSGSSSASAGRAPPEDDDGDGDVPLRRDHGDGPGKSGGDAPAKPPPRVGLAGALDALEAAEYATAEAELTKAAKNPKDKGAAAVGLARLALETGKLAEAVKLADEASLVDKPSKIAAAAIKARALAAQGKLELALKACEAVKDEADARRARLAMGEILLRQGKSRDASAPLMTLIEDFNQKRITTKDGEGMALVARASHLLRSKTDANEAYNDAEKAGLRSPELFLWRAELFLEAYNIGRADEMLREARKRAPELAAVHMMDARIRLEQALDFDAAEKAVKKALAINKALPEAYFVRAGIALRDMEIEQADKWLAEGFAIDPKDLDLLSMKATVRFMADDKEGFKRGIAAVFDLNKEYAKMYAIVAEFADWEHRYAEIAAMMKEATKIDPDDGRLFVTLGLNQIRLGQEKEGVASLDTGFRKDKFNVRAFNTLKLYETDIPQHYEDVTTDAFRIRYPKKEKKVLELYADGLGR